MLFLNLPINEKLKMVTEADLKIQRMRLNPDIAWLTVKVIGKEAEVELAPSQSLGIVDREEPGPAHHRRGQITRVIG
jgi:hypothetical protein